MKIFINAGHCAEYKNGRMQDSGAINRLYGLTEAETVLKISKQLKFYLENVGIECVLMQTNNLRNNPIDDDLTQPCIVVEANKSRCDYAISVHCNAFNGLARGTENIVFERESEAEDLAEHIQARIVNQIGTIDRGIKYEEDKYFGNRLSFIMKTNMPAVIVECCFIDNNSDAEYLLDEGTDKFAKAIYDGIIDYLEWEIK